MASWWNCFIICSQAPVKLKLKMREDLSDKEITDISVSSTSFSKEFSVYIQSVQSTGKIVASRCNIYIVKSLQCSLYLELLSPGIKSRNQRSPKDMCRLKSCCKSFYFFNVMQFAWLLRFYFSESCKTERTNIEHRIVSCGSVTLHWLKSYFLLGFVQFKVRIGVLLLFLLFNIYLLAISVFLQSEHRFDPLPPGWFYNGSHYVSLTGDKDYKHPCILLIKRLNFTFFPSFPSENLISA